MSKTAKRSSTAARAVTNAIVAVGVSRRSWTHALQVAAKQAAAIAPRVTGVDVTRTHAVVRAGKIVAYRVEVGVTPEAEPLHTVPHTWCCEPW